MKIEAPLNFILRGLLAERRCGVRLNGLKAAAMSNILACYPQQQPIFGHSFLSKNYLFSPQTRSFLFLNPSRSFKPDSLFAKTGISRR